MRFSGHFADVRHSRLSAEQSDDLALIGEDVEAGDIFHIYLHGGAIPERVLGSEDEVVIDNRQDSDLPLMRERIDFRLTWNPVSANHAHVWSQPSGDTAVPDAYLVRGTVRVEIQRIACNTAYIRFISTDGDLSRVLPERYVLEISKGFRDNRGNRHWQVITDQSQVIVESLLGGSLLKVSKDVSHETLDAGTRQTLHHRIRDVCADRHGVNNAAYIRLRLTETAVLRAPPKPQGRITTTWANMKARD